MTNNYQIHYCKHCNTHFTIKLHEHESGDFFLICPNCDGRHYRHFKNGIAEHCNLNIMNDKIIEVVGLKI
jgi:esterase/lipase superfamily enzyme